MTRLRIRRGFTAVEFMVAVTAGLAVSVAAYTLSKSSVDVFQQEARLNAAQFSSMMGMNRLSADIKRAGFQTTPEVGEDPNVCVVPAAGGNFPDPDLLVAARVTEGGPFNANVAYTGDYVALPAAFASLNNRRSPDRLRLSANFGASSSFRISRMENDFVWLDIDQLSVQRIYQAAQSSGGFGICSAFQGLPVPDNTGAPVAPAGRPAIRLVDNAGRSRFALIANCAAVNGSNNYASVRLQLSETPVGPGCTTMDVTSPGYVNPVQFVDYALFGAVDVAANFAAIGLPPPIGAMAGEDVALEPITGASSRTFLVRRELDGVGNVVPASAEVVADFVVDLNFSARRRVGAAVQALGFDTLAGIPPNEIRSLGVRLSTRARNPDRAVGQVAPPNANQTITRFDVFAGAADTRDRWARVRTMFSEVSLPNLQGDAF